MAHRRIFVAVIAPEVASRLRRSDPRGAPHNTELEPVSRTAIIAPPRLACQTILSNIIIAFALHSVRSHFIPTTTVVAAVSGYSLLLLTS